MSVLEILNMMTMLELVGILAGIVIAWMLIVVFALEPIINKWNNVFNKGKRS